MEYHELLKVCETVEINVTNEMAIAVEKAMRNQSNSKLWFKNRAGRITASRMKAVCHTDAANPSQSLMKCICYPELFCFTSRQTDWGCKHEKQATDLYLKMQITQTFSDLIINPLWPHIGASPDGYVHAVVGEPWRSNVTVERV